MIATTILALLFSLQEPVPLEIGKALHGVLPEDAERVRTAGVDPDYRDRLLVGLPFRFRVEEAGVYTIDLRSDDIDAYLILTDAEGKLLAQDDDGLGAKNARLVLELQAPREYRLLACSLFAEPGDFELVVHVGAPIEGDSELGEEDGVEHFRKIAERVREESGALSIEYSEALNDLSVELFMEGSLKESLDLIRGAYSIKEKVLGEDHPDSVALLYNTGYVLMNMRDFEAARPILERVLAIRERTLGPDHPDTADSLNNLGVLLRITLDLDGALELHQRALVIREKTLDPNDPEITESRQDVAGMLVEKGDFDAARPLLERSLEVAEEIYGPDHLDTAEALSDLAKVVRKQGDHAGALAFLNARWRSGRCAWEGMI